MQSELPDTPERSTWSDPDQEDGPQTDDTTTKSPSNHSGTTSSTVTHEAGSPRHRDYVTSVAGETPDEDDIREFIEGLELWYSGDFPNDHE